MKLIEWKFGKKQQRWNWYPIVDGAPDLAAPDARRDRSVKPTPSVELALKPRGEKR